MVRGGVRIGFTLVELLVVVAVLGLLLTLLLPVLGMSRELAKKTVCSSNLREIEIGWVGFITHENNGTFPYTKSVHKHPNWIDALDTAYPEAVSQWGTDAQAVSSCPTIRHEYTKMYYPGIRWGYAINVWWKGVPSEYNELQAWAHVEKPASYPMFMDGEVAKFGSGHGIPPYVPLSSRGSPDWGVGAVHGDGQIVNVAFADTSVRGVQIDQVRQGMLAADQYPWLQN